MSMHFSRSVGLALVASLVVGAAARAQTHWPQFRGDAAGVIADDPTLPDSWSTEDNVEWVTDLPGRSWSSPIVWGDHVFVLAVTNLESGDAPVQAVENYRARSLGGSMTAAYTETSDEPLTWVLYDFDFESGALRWEQRLHTGVPALSTHLKSSYASETPVTDGERVYVAMTDIGVFAVDFEGEIEWSTPLEWLPRRGWGAAGCIW